MNRWKNLVRQLRNIGQSCFKDSGFWIIFLSLLFILLLGILIQQTYENNLSL